MNLPPYISRTPPPINETEDDEDEEFGTFAICSDLGEDVCDVFEKTSSHIIRSEDNVSEDSGFCMNSIGLTQSPCDISPLSSSYSKGNECMSIDNHGDIVLHSSIKETETSKSEDMKLSDTCLNHITFIQNLGNFNSSDDIYNDSSESVKMPEYSNRFQNEFLFSESSNFNTDKVYIVDNCATYEFVTDNVFSYEADTQQDSHIQVLTDTGHQESSEVLSESNWFKNDDQSDIGNTLKFTNHTKLMSKNELLNKDLYRLRPENTPCPVENGLAAPQSPVHATLPFSGNNIEYVTSEGTNEEVDKQVDGCDSEDDEFSDFTSFQVIESFPEVLKPDSKSQNQSKRTETIQGEIIDNISVTLQTAIENNVVWNSLVCFEETPAFKYQWSTSSTQMKFLQALQIDSRNILFGPWSKVNKFNWYDVSSSFENSNCNIDCPLASVTTKNKDVIPDAHFDWITSGLINPLQGTSNEKEIVHNLEENSSSEMLVTRSRDIVNSLPKLSFLKSTCINFK